MKEKRRSGANVHRLNTLSDKLLESVESRDLEAMCIDYEALEEAYDEEFGDKIENREQLLSICRLDYARLKYLAFGNFFETAHSLATETVTRIDSYLEVENTDEDFQRSLSNIRDNIKSVIRGLKPQHENIFNHRRDSRCCLCRKRIANKTGSHMVPNFLAHPSFAGDRKGKRDKEALDHHFINRADKNCSYYGRGVTVERIEQVEGKDIPEDFAENNINQLEFDNEFCSVCEDRWGILETTYSKFYSGIDKVISPRLSYLFWLSVVYRMSWGSMGMQMLAEDELALRKLLDNSILDSEKEISSSTEDLGTWNYALFRAEGLAIEGDKGIFGAYNHYPYVIMVNDCIVVFYSNTPSEDELTVGPITVNKEQLNTWKSEEKFIKVDRRFFWNVRDWIEDIHRLAYDPPREMAEIQIREEERHLDSPLSDDQKDLLINVARLAHPNFDKPVTFRKMRRFFIADLRRKEALAKGEDYDILADDEVFLSQKNVSDYFEDLSEAAQCGIDVRKMPFYDDARKAISADEKWEPCKEIPFPNEEEYIKTMDWYLNEVLDEKGREKQFHRMMFGEQNPIRVNKIGRNDPCPCGSGKKYKKCCGK